MQRKKCTSIPFFSLVSYSIPWFDDVGWPVCKCSQSMALLLNTSYLLLATFEQSYNLFSHTGCLRSLLLASLVEVTYLFSCPDSWTQRFFKRMGRHSWDFYSLCWTLSSEPFSWWIKKSQKQDEGDRNNINLVNSQLPLPCSGEEHGQYWSISWHPCQSFGLGFLQQPLVHVQAMLGPLVTYLHLSLRLQVLYKSFFNYLLVSSENVPRSSFLSGFLLHCFVPRLRSLLAVWLLSQDVPLLWLQAVSCLSPTPPAHLRFWISLP